MSAAVPVAELLALLAAEPELLDPAPEDLGLADFAARAAEGHLCLRCGASPVEAIVYHAPEDRTDRWLDVCPECKRAVAEFFT